MVIAVFFTARHGLWAPAGAPAGLAVFAPLQRLRVRGWWWYVPLGPLVWVLTLRSGVHATVSGVAVGLLLRARPDPGEAEAPGVRAEHLLRPWSAGAAVLLVRRNRVHRRRAAAAEEG